MTGIGPICIGSFPAGRTERTIGVKETTATMTSKSSLDKLPEPHDKSHTVIIRMVHRTRGIITDFTSTYPDVLRFLNIWKTVTARRVMMSVIESTVIIKLKLG